MTQMRLFGALVVTLFASAIFTSASPRGSTPRSAVAAAQKFYVADGTGSGSKVAGDCDSNPSELSVLSSGSGKLKKIGDIDFNRVSAIDVGLNGKLYGVGEKSNCDIAFIEINTDNGQGTEIRTIGNAQDDDNIEAVTDMTVRNAKEFLLHTFAFSPPVEDLRRIKIKKGKLKKGLGVASADCCGEGLAHVSKKAAGRLGFEQPAAVTHNPTPTPKEPKGLWIVNGTAAERYKKKGAPVSSAPMDYGPFGKGARVNAMDRCRDQKVYGLVNVGDGGPEREPGLVLLDLATATLQLVVPEVVGGDALACID